MTETLSSPLALLGGPKTRVQPFPAHRVITEAEMRAVRQVLESQILSRYLGCWHADFWGGPEIDKLRKKACHYFGAEYALPLNSATSGLYAAVGAVGAEPGDEVICSPYTMGASATCALANLLVPVFADIDQDTLCLDPASIERNIGPRTRAIVVVHIMGCPADMDAIMAIARRHDLVVIEDCAQAPGARYQGRPVGTLGHIGVFSLNYHKHVHTGEGGIVVTNDRRLHHRMALIHNHGECVLASAEAQAVLGVGPSPGLVGQNYRMGEMEAAVASSLLDRLDGLLEERRANCAHLGECLAGLPHLRLPVERPGDRHVYYTYTMQYDPAGSGVHRNRYVEAVRAELPVTELREGEGPLVCAGYVHPLYLQPVYQQRRAYGTSAIPWSLVGREISYAKGICPVTERMHAEVTLRTELMRPGMSRADIDDAARAFEKVSRRIKDLA